MSSLATRFRQIGRHRPRLLAAATLAITVFFFLPGSWTFTARVLVAWNLGVWPFLAALVWLMVRTSPEGVRGIARIERARASR